MKKNYTKQIIWTTGDYHDESAMREWARSLDGEYSERELWEMWCECVNDSLDFERETLNIETDGIIICLADIGVWNGRRRRIGRAGSNVSDILESDCDMAEFYGDGYNVRSRQSHHDGTNCYLFRIVKDESAYERLTERAYEGRLTERYFMRNTESVYPYVAAVYGWKVRNAGQRRRMAEREKERGRTERMLQEFRKCYKVAM